MKALVVDDELISRTVVHKILSAYAEVHICVDGHEAVLAHRRALERGEPYDLICMDILMPTMGGIEALKLIRKEEELHGRFRPRGTKVVILSADGDSGTIQQAFRELCDAYVVKPIHAEGLIDIVNCLFPLEEHKG